MLPYLQSLCQTEARAAGRANDAEPSHRFAAAPPDGFRTPVAEEPYPRPTTRGPGNGAERLCGTLSSCGTECEKVGAHNQIFGPGYQRRDPRRKLGASIGTGILPYQSASARDHTNRFQWNFHQNRAAPQKLTKLCKRAVHTLEIYWWGEDYCRNEDRNWNWAEENEPVEEDHPNSDSYTWRIQIEYRNGELQNTFSDGNIPDPVLALMEKIADLFV